MKKKYLTPEAESCLVTIEANFLASTRNATSSMDLTIDDVDSGSFWDYE